MNLSTLVSPAVAAEQLKAYEAQLAEERTPEDVAIAAGYRAAARGLPVISMQATIKAGGYFPTGLPRIAVVRADAVDCWVDVNAGRESSVLVFADRNDSRDRGRLPVGAHTVRVRVDERIERTDVPGRWIPGGHTVVPTIPPNIRPKARRLHLHHILWEVEAWDPTPPKDPALLRHLRGDLWSVLAVWDLTELERAVLTQRAPS